MGFTTKEEVTAKISGVLTDEDGNGLDVALVSALSLTLYNRADGSIINSRDHISILNVNGGTLDSSGNFSWIMNPDDNAIIDDSLDNEVHCALVEFTYAGGRQGKELIIIAVENLEKVPYVPAPPGANPIAIPSRTFFVSAGFTDLASPFFTTIQAAIDAALDDGNWTTILVYPGTYIEAISWKANVKLLGVSREQVVITLQSAGTIINVHAVAQGQSFSIENITIDAGTVAGIVGLSIPVNVASTSWTIRNCYFRSIGSGSIGLNFQLSTVTVGTLEVEECYFESGTNGLGVNWVNTAGDGFRARFLKCRFKTTANTSHCMVVSEPSYLKVEKCLFESTTTSTGTYFIYLTSGNYLGSTNRLMEVIGCTFRYIGIGTYANGIYSDATQANAGIVVVAGCKFIASGINLVGAGCTHQWEISNCSFDQTRRILGISNGSHIVLMSGCHAVMKTNGDIGISVIATAVSPTIKMWGCSIYSGQCFQAAASGTYSIVNCVLRVGQSLYCIGGSAFTIFLGNVTSDQSIDPQVIQAAGSFNVQTSVGI